ncbi:MAG: hypothetical protein K2G18_09300 [Bacteroidales bacterium]|nr:hypothetical protein [Bacteroidales bacterium]MDE6148228.1 hypothetical protein [Bacteroidales bacterium]
MKKILLFIATILIANIAAHGQAKNSSYDKGYRPNIEAGIHISSSSKFIYGITSSHGYNWGNGLYLGGLTGIMYTSEAAITRPNRIMIPLLAEIKYSFINRLASPFISLKAGCLADVTEKGIGYEILPAVGVDIWRFSINIGFDTYQCTYSYKYLDTESNTMKPSAIGVGSAGVHLGVSYTF